ncbi:MAG: DUF1295 domain-containing protein [Candidatus Lernaella stagnicola]|nr:DUF1295 domain-containing protein [Candidatus Lernaella stagnicola]
MSEWTFYRGFVVAWSALSLLIFLYLLARPAPYGRHQRAGWGPGIRARAGWLWMELPAVLAFAVFFVMGLSRVGVVTLSFFLIWQFHYVYRTFIFPARLPATTKTMPLTIVLSGFVFNVANAYLNGRYLFELGPAYPLAWFSDPRFVIGTATFTVGFLIHSRSDAALIRLRREGGGYRVPHGGLFRFISCPNYFGEILQWGGWALLTWSPGGLVFFIWTAANLLPRARAHHQWYQRTFADYPARRRAVIPFLW